MTKTNGNTGKLNQNIANILNQKLPEKLLGLDELVETKKIYVVFFDTNMFRICKETLKRNTYCVAHELSDYFTNSLVSFSVNDIRSTKLLPWEKNGKFSLLYGEEAIAIPIKVFLEKHIVKDVTTKKNIINLYNVICEYIKENPNFIKDIFDEKINQKQI